MNNTTVIKTFILLMSLVCSSAVAQNFTAPLNVTSNYDAIATFKTTDNTWLYTQWLNSSGQRRAYMGLSSDLSEFRLNLENGTTEFNISGANIGIGTTSPKERLDVRGAINIYRGSNGKDSFIMSDDDPKIWSSANSGASYPFRDSDLGHLILQPRTSALRDILFVTGDGNDIRMSIKGDGNIGIGTTSPKERLDVLGAINIYRGSNGKDSFIMSDHDPKIWSSANSGTSYPFRDSDLGHLILQPRTSALRDILFVTGDGDDIRMSIKGDGNVGIGTTAPTQKLSVDGKINAEEIILEDVAGADFVFEEDYDLRTLEETEQFIKANKHLPEVPSAAEMAEEGLELKQMNILLLQKVEELTLHLIRMEKEAKTNAAEFAAKLLEQEKQIEALKEAQNNN